tara:strand:+ start:42 stop:758 length:717 start_codon:yes stop_codon:yes gene_type:complete
MLRKDYLKMTLRVLKLLPVGSFLSLVLCNSVAAQTLELFEETENNASQKNESSPRSNRRDSEGNMITGPEFTLVGTTRIGDNYLVVVKDRSGVTVSTRVLDGSIATISDHSGYKVTRAGAGSVSISYPEGLPCAPFPEQGVTCENSNVARLTLTNAVPLAASAAVNRSIGSPSENSKVEDSSTVNPFEALLERAANPNAEANNVDTDSFRPRRIDPQDVPAGMRVVSTPFGDRLVEDE